jgi:gluconolactonase
VWVPENGGYLLFSDPNANTIYRWSEDDQITVFRPKSGYTGRDIGEYRQPGSNGLTLDREGRLTINEHGNHRVTRLEKNGVLTVLADSYEGKRLNSPNDLVYRRDGSLYFTDPPFGILGMYEGEVAAPEQATTNIYRVDGQSGRITIASNEINRPNGLAFSPDEKKLYVIEAGASPRQFRVFDVAADGKLSNNRVFLQVKDGETPDGFRLDVDGNLWCGWGMGNPDLDGVMVFAPDGTPIGQIKLPERCANLCFGGRANSRLFMASSQSIYALYVNVAGA